MYFCIMTSTMGQKSLKVLRFTFLAVSSTVRKKETILVISSCKNLLLREIVHSKSHVESCWQNTGMEKKVLLSSRGIMHRVLL